VKPPCVPSSKPFTKHTFGKCYSMTAMNQE
jgi:hypothetical protein